MGLLRGIDAVVNRFERVAEVRLGGRRFPAADLRGYGWGQRKSQRAERSRRAQCDHSHIPLFCDLALLINLRASGLLNGTDREPIQEVAMSLTDWNEVAVHSLLADADLILKFFTAETSGDNSEEIWLSVGQVRAAYSDLQQRRANLKISPLDEAELQSKLDQMRARLRFFGEAA